MNDTRYPFLQGGGEMGKLTRNFDWSGTALGAPDRWPVSLRTMVSVVLRSNFPMSLWWGKELVGFYNDAFRECLLNEVKQPLAPGQNGGESDPGIWKLIGPTIGAVMAGGDGAPNENHSIAIDSTGRGAAVYRTFSYTPVPDDDGTTGGVLVTCQESADAVAQAFMVQQLQESEAKLRGVIAAAPAGIGLFIGRDLIIEHPNQTFIDIVGKGPGVEGLPLREAMPELLSEGQPFLNILDDVFTTGMPFVSPASLVKIVQDGVLNDNYYNISYTPLRDAAGEIYGILDIAIDVTAQVKAQQALQESEVRFQSLIRDANVGMIVLLGEEMRVAVVNEAYCRLIGHAVEETLNRPLFDVIPDAEAYFRPLLAKTQTTGNPFEETETPYKVRGAGGETITGFVDFTYQPYCEADGSITGVMVVVNDVTAQVMARRKLEETEANLRTAIELAELATWTIDLEQERIVYSPRLQEWLGLPERAISFSASPMVHERDRERVTEALRVALVPGGTGVFDEVYAITHVTTGQHRIIHSNGKTSFDPAGNPVLIIGTSQDITIQRELQTALENKVQLRTEELASAVEELRATNEELAMSNELLTHSNEELAQYAYVASHDLQEPLRKIRVFAGLLGNAKELLPGSRVTLEKIGSSAERMSLLIQDLLSFSRLLKSDSLMRPIALVETVKAVWTDFELVVEEREAALEMAALPVIEAVGLQMNQLFYNLISNALKFVAPGRRPRVTILSHPVSMEDVLQYIPKPLDGARYHHITISDNGIGFETRYNEQIFEVFKRLHGREMYPGSGIGLALCRRIVANHNGYLYAVSEQGAGSTFHIILPERQEG